MVRAKIGVITQIQEELEASQVESGRGTKGISEKTVKNYIDRLYKTITTHGTWNGLVKWVDGKYKSQNSQISFYSAYLGAIKHSEFFAKKINEEQREEIKKRQMELVKGRTATTEQHTIKQVVSYDELLELYPKLSGQEKLMLAFYILMPPKRGDFGRIQLLNKEEAKDTQASNFLDVSNFQLTIKDHKTRSTFQYIKENLPEEVKKLLRKSLKETPRRWLFLTPGGEEFKDNEAFTKWVRSVLTPHFGKTVGIDALRHAYITEFHKNSKTYAEQKDVASKMGHSVAESHRYRQEA